MSTVMPPLLNCGGGEGAESEGDTLTLPAIDRRSNIVTLVYGYESDDEVEDASGHSSEVMWLCAEWSQPEVVHGSPS